MIQTECVYCHEPLLIPLNEDYLRLLADGEQLVSQEICPQCERVNYVEHRRDGGETFGEDDDRAKELKELL